MDADPPPAPRRLSLLSCCRKAGLHWRCCWWLVDHRFRNMLLLFPICKRMEDGSPDREWWSLSCRNQCPFSRFFDMKFDIQIQILGPVRGSQVWVFLGSQSFSKKKREGHKNSSNSSQSVLWGPHLDHNTIPAVIDGQSSTPAHFDRGDVIVGGQEMFGSY